MSSSVAPSGPRGNTFVVRSTAKQKLRLEKEDQFELARQYRDTGSDEAREELFRSGIGWALKLAHWYAFLYNIPQFLEDLVQEASFGLWKATTSFNPAKGYAFSTWSTFEIKCHILRFVVEQSEAVGIAKGHFFNRQRLRRYCQYLEERLHRPPTDAELVAEGFKPAVLASLRNYSFGGSISLDTPQKDRDEDEDTRPPIILSTEQAGVLLDHLVYKQSCGVIARFLHANYKQHQAMAAILRFGLEGRRATYPEIGRILSISESQARKLVRSVQHDGKFTWFLTTAMRMAEVLSKRHKRSFKRSRHNNAAQAA